MGSINTSPVLSIVEATVAELASALAQGHVNSVELTAKHLNRIAKYDRRFTLLNSIPVINLDVFEAAQASDQRRALGQTASLLDGIPCTIKDSYKIQGMTVAAGSPAFKDLIATEDAFTVKKIKEAGAVILGRTNMPPMAAGGMQRGLYGRAESPYNAEYLTAAFASGSSNGSATATAASFSVFGMGEETISSGRSPASNNGLVAYTPSRGLISIRGNWPLFPTCDTVVPHTRTVGDMFALLNIIVAEDHQSKGDFWREQPFIKLPDLNSVRPNSYQELADPTALAGKRIGVPKMYIGQTDRDPSARKVHTRQSVIELWRNVRRILEGLGANVQEVDFPVVTKFEKAESDVVGAACNDDLAPPHRNDINMCQLMAYAWDDFLADNGDANVAVSLMQVSSAAIFPRPPRSPPDKYDSSDPLVRHTDVVAHITADRMSTYDIPGLGKALHDLEYRRKTDFEDWLDALGLDIMLGIPTVSVPMGVMADTGMPVNLTFASKAYDDSNLLRYAFSFEKGSQLRKSPPRTPGLKTDIISTVEGATKIGLMPPKLVVDSVTMLDTKDGKKVRLRGRVLEAEVSELCITVDGDESEGVKITDGKWEGELNVISAWEGRPGEKGSPDPNKAMVIIVARGRNGRSAGKLLFI
ncbi:amidase signature enzyme [Colletotrichum zoysiae]|uniref:Amidase signature enzyme n=1 Tax=Colletotrichum zoysiae TaxID=1216348 RepID=A0AAD9HEQ5_9PEZI|nr:amidase signature enzyme [Colletotrichum zoysiae]